MARISIMGDITPMTDEDLAKLDKWYADNKVAFCDCNELGETPNYEPSVDDEGIAILDELDFDIACGRVNVNIFILKHGGK